MKKVLIIAGGLQLGGAERVAANIQKYAPPGEYEFHYVVFEGNENVYGAEIEQNGGRVFTFPSPRAGYQQYIASLAGLIDEHHYVAVHSHTMFNSGINLAVAKSRGVPCRIAHSHTTKTETKVSIVQKFYEFLMQRMILANATHLFACGVEAGNWLFGKKAFARKGIVIRNGIDTHAFSWSPENREKIRKQYGIPEDEFVIGHSGTLIPLKNQSFLIELLPEILKEKPNAMLMLLGKGEESEIERLKATAQKMGVLDRVLFCGGVMNVNERLSAFDVFAFPSLREGTPLALLEAQANGLPCIVSDNIPGDAFLTECVHPVSLRRKDAWICGLCDHARMAPERYAAEIAASGYDAETAYAPIYEAYAGRTVGRKAVVSLSFDDGRGDNTAVIEDLLLPMQIPVTLNVTTGYVDGTCPKELLPTEKPPMTADDVIRLSKSPFVEIALHGDNHLNTAEDILAGRQKLLEWLELPGNHLLGFASPGSGLSIEEFKSSECTELRGKLRYMRTSLRITTMKPLRILCRKAGRVLHWPAFYRLAYADTLMSFRDGKVVYSVPVLKDISVAQLCGLVDLCIRKNASLTVMFHSILPDVSGEDNWTWSRDRFEEFCRYLCAKRAEGRIELCTTAELHKRLI